MASNETQNALSDYVDEHLPRYIERLTETVAIPSVSADLENHLGDIIKMIEWTRNEAEKLGGKTKTLDNPAATAERPLPPILLVEFSSGDPKKMTVCAYGHLDVQPAKKQDGWNTDPFVLTEMDGKLYGRGSTDDKGQALSWLWAVEAHRDLNMELPVNLKLLFEGMEEYGSDGVFEAIVAESKDPAGFLSNVDFFCVTDNYWLGREKPCLTYGLRGLAYFTLTIRALEQDLHSGTYGGSVPEAMTDLVRLMGSLVDSQGTILVDGVMDDVKPKTPEEDAMYETIDFNTETYQKDECQAKGGKLLHDSKKDILMARWRYPTLSLHGIQGAFSGAGAKTVIPASVIGKFSLRLVADQDPEKIHQAVQRHLEKEFAKLGSFNIMELDMIYGGKPWLANPKHPNYEAGARAIEKVFGKKPDYTREGGSIPVVLTLSEATGMSVMLLPLGSCDDMAHSQNEKYNISNLLSGIKVVAMYMHEIATIRGTKPSKCVCVPLTDEELMVPGAFLKGFRCKCEM